MATNLYCTAEQLKERLGIASTDTADDEKLDSMAQGISRAIDEVMRRRFVTTDNDETRYFTASDTQVLYPGDVVSVTTLSTDSNGDRTYETTWLTTDFDLEPFNAALDGKPYTSIRTTPLGSQTFPLTAKGIKVVGKFGWPAIPANVREAALLTAERLFKRKDAIFGIVGNLDLGELRQIVKDDPEIKTLLFGMDDKGKLV